MKKLCSLLLALVAIFSLLSGIDALAKTPSLVDDAKLLTKEEKKDIRDALEAVEEKYQVRVAIVTVKSTGGKETGTYANHVLDKAYTDGENGNMVLILAMDTRDAYISTNNAMRAKITDEAGIDYLFDGFHQQLKDDRYADAFLAYASRVDEMLDYYQTEGEAYDPDADIDFYMAFGLSLIMALIFGFVVRYGLIASMSNVRRQTAADAYLVKNSFRLTDQKDTFLFMNITRTPKEKDRDRGSGGSAADSSHGGGGRHF